MNSSSKRTRPAKTEETVSHRQNSVTKDGSDPAVKVTACPASVVLCVSVSYYGVKRVRWLYRARITIAAVVNGHRRSS